MKPSWLPAIPLVLTLSIAFVLAFIESENRSEYFSTSSLGHLKELNQKHGMVVDDLMATEEESPLIAELLQANALIPIPTADRENKGLIVSLDPKTSENILLLQPVTALSDLELATAAAEYEEVIPEFIHVEMDQEVELFGPFYNWFFEPSSSEGVVLSDEKDESETSRIQVAVIDSGVDAEHEIFADNPVVKGWNTITDDTFMYDDVGHGTHVAGIIASETQNIEIVPYKIVDSRGGKLSNVIEALSKALEDEVDLINMSFGLATASHALRGLVEKAYDQDIILVAAAGNNNTSHGFYPAEYDEYTIAVASVDSAGNKMPNSNYGDWVDVAAYGYHIRSSLPENEYGYKSGTSQATAKVSAQIVDLLLSASSSARLSMEQVLSGFRSNGKLIKEGKLAGVIRIQ